MHATEMTTAAITALLTLDKPAHSDWIVNYCFDHKLFALYAFGNNSKTPAQTLANALNREIREQGKKSRFVRTAPATFGLNPAFYPTFGASKPLPNPPSDTLPSGFVKFGGEEKREAYYQQKVDVLPGEPDFLTKLVNAANTMVAKIREEFWL
jgi:HB1, ASXL, restriction endonuclease HTH domain